MKLWQKNCLAALVLTMSVGFVSGAEASITSKQQDDAKYIEVKEAVPVKILADYRKQGYSGVVDLGTYTKIDDQAMLAMVNARYGGNNVGAGYANAQCSSCIKPVMLKGERVLLYGRNMDLPVAYSPAYVLRINEPGKYKSVNIGYWNTLEESFDQIAATGTIEKKLYERLPYSVSDVMNEKGLVIECNMRSSCKELVCKGTNPGKMRMVMSVVPRYLVDHCATIGECLEAVKELDIYTADSDLLSWHIAFAMMDATGRYGVMELIKDKLVWHEGHPGQTNFWIDRKAAQIDKNDCGYGRWASLMAGYNNIRTMDDMRRNMEKVWYSSLFRDNVEEMTYDPATEMTETDVQAEIDRVLGWQKQYGIKVDKCDLAKVQAIADEQIKNKVAWNNDFIQNPENYLKVYTVLDFISRSHKQLPNKAKKLGGLFECSDISYVVNNKEKVYHVKFFEQPKIFHLGVEK